MHLTRLVPLLEAAGLRVAVLNHFHSTEMPYVVGALRRNPIRYYLLPKRVTARVVHYHHSRWSTLVGFALGMDRASRRYVITLHSPEIRNRLESRFRAVRWMTKWALRRFDAIVVVSPTIRDAIRDHVRPGLIEVIPAYVEARDDDYRYADSIAAFLSSAPTLVVPAYRVQFFRGGLDMYGLDLAIEAFERIAAQRNDVQLAFFIAEPSVGRRQSQYLDVLRRRLDGLGLRERTLFAFGLPLVPAFQQDVIVVRPTRSDGDALSVREALEAGVPVVASDVVERPAGAQTFRTEDVDGLARVLTEVLDRAIAKGTTKSAAARVPQVSFLERLTQIYRRQLGAAP